jgi:hypothetical protein
LLPTEVSNLVARNQWVLGPCSTDLRGFSSDLEELFRPDEEYLIDSAVALIRYSCYEEVYLLEGRSRSVDLDFILAQDITCASGQIVSPFRECHHWTE